ncbi:hypothetical protein NBRC10512_000873 [Rhodotorula toruloides]
MSEGDGGCDEESSQSDKILKALEKIDERIKVAKTNLVDKDEGKEVSLGTSKINYLDPHGCPIQLSNLERCR